MLNMEVKSPNDFMRRPLVLTLSEVFFGVLKRIKIPKLVVTVDETKKTDNLAENILNIYVKPGLPKATEIVFAKQQDREGIIFVTEDQPHEIFHREGNDLLMTVDISLKDALNGTIITVNTIDDRIIRVLITRIITFDHREYLQGEGMPILEKPSERGDLIINFKIQFPIYLSVTSKNYITKAFDDES